MTSYRLGMGLTKIVMERVLGVPWLIHVDRLIAQGFATLVSGSESRPDLAGPDTNGQWHVAEAKGRSNPPSGSDLADAKSQSGRIYTINGAPPITRCASLAALAETPLRVHLHDPDGKGGYGISVDSSALVRASLKSFVTFVREGSSIEETVLGQRYVVAQRPLAWLQRSGRGDEQQFVRVGVAEGVLQAWNSADLFSHSARVARQLAERAELEAKTEEDDNVDASMAGTIGMRTNARGRILNR